MFRILSQGSGVEPDLMVPFWIFSGNGKIKISDRSCLIGTIFNPYCHGGVVPFAGHGRRKAVCSIPVDGFRKIGFRDVQHVNLRTT